MTGRIADRPGARTAKRDGVEHFPRGETEYLEATGAGGCVEQERMLTIDGERAHPIDGWSGIEYHLVGSRVHHMDEVVVAAIVPLLFVNHQLMCKEILYASSNAVRN